MAAAKLMTDKALKKNRLTRAESNAVRCKTMIEATSTVIAEFDLDGTTIDRICEAAAISPGLVGHHFGSRVNLLIRVCEATFEEHQALLQGLLSDPSMTATERLFAIVESNFTPPAYTSVKAGVWLAFFNASRSQEVFRQVVTRGAEGYRNLFVQAFDQAAKQIGASIDCTKSAVGLIALMDGLWSSLAIGKDPMTPKEANDICMLYVRDRLGI